MLGVQVCNVQSMLVVFLCDWERFPCEQSGIRCTLNTFTHSITSSLLFFSSFVYRLFGGCVLHEIHSIGPHFNQNYLFGFVLSTGEDSSYLSLERSLLLFWPLWWLNWEWKINKMNSIPQWTFRLGTFFPIWLLFVFCIKFFFLKKPK